MKFLRFNFTLLAIMMYTIIPMSCNQQRLTEDDMAGYLLVYFKEYGHNVYFAVSRDGYTFTDVNGGEPVMKGDTLALQKGIRDSHIYRGPNNMGFCETTDFVNYNDLGHFNEGVMKTTNFESPKHGAVVQITEREMKRLMKHWNFEI